MARGPTKQANTENQIGAQQNKMGQQIFGTEMPAITNMIQNPGYDTATKNAIIGQSVEAANAPFSSAADQATRTAGRTGNAAGLDVSLDSLARGKSAADANAAQQAQIAIANDAQQQRQLGISDASNLFGTTEGTMAKIYGDANSLYGIPKKGGLFDVFKTLTDAGAKVASAGLAGGGGGGGGG